jgi:hypothetical protein
MQVQKAHLHKFTSINDTIWYGLLQTCPWMHLRLHPAQQSLVLWTDARPISNMHQRKAAGSQSLLQWKQLSLGGLKCRVYPLITMASGHDKAPPGLGPALRCFPNVVVPRGRSPECRGASC